MQSQSKQVADYLLEASEKRQAALNRLRELCLSTLTDYEESMAYGMPSYKHNGAVAVAFASQKQYISLYILKHEVMRSNADLLTGLDYGKGCIRFKNPAKIDFDLVQKLLQATVESPDTPC